LGIGQAARPRGPSHAEGYALDPAADVELVLPEQVTVRRPVPPARGLLALAVATGLEVLGSLLDADV
jgi:hypothetical protein